MAELSRSVATGHWNGCPCSLALQMLCTVGVSCRARLDGLNDVMVVYGVHSLDLISLRVALSSDMYLRWSLRYWSRCCTRQAKKSRLKGSRYFRLGPICRAASLDAPLPRATLRNCLIRREPHSRKSIDNPTTSTNSPIMPDNRLVYVSNNHLVANPMKY